MVPADRDRSVAVNINFVIAVGGFLSMIMAIFAIDFRSSTVLGVLLLLVLIIIMVSAIVRLSFDARQRQNRLKYMSYYGKLAESIIKKAVAAELRIGGQRHYVVIQEVAEIFANMFCRLTGERVWISIRQVYSDGEDLWIHDVLSDGVLESINLPAPGDNQASPAFRAVWGRIRQAFHPYYVCGNIEKEWYDKARSMGRTAEESSWNGFYRHLVGYFGRYWTFAYKSMIVLPIGAGASHFDKESKDSVIAPWGYMSVMSDMPRAFSDPSVRDMGRRCAGMLSTLLVLSEGKDAITELEVKDISPSAEGSIFR